MIKTTGDKRKQVLNLENEDPNKRRRNILKSIPPVHREGMQKQKKYLILNIIIYHYLNH